MSSRSSSPLSSAQDLDSDPEMDFEQPTKSTKTTNSPGGKTDLSRSKSPSEGSPPPHKKRKVVDPRDPLPQDNPSYAFIVAFQAKFNQLFRGVPNMGPQDIEAGLLETPIPDNIEALLCKILGLALNRQKQVEKGHYARALEEAVATFIEEAPPEWGDKNPLEGGKTFNQMSVDERLLMLQTLILWALRHSRSIGDIIKDVYKPGRKSDDSNIPLAVHCWGMDREKNKYYLIEGKDDTHFRVYQEHISPSYRNATWVDVAGSIEELQDLAERLGQEGSKNAKDLQAKIYAAIPRFEEGEQKRKRREYRNARKAAFSNPGVSMYEGRTRGNKAKYTFDSDDEGGYASGRATRGTRASGRVSPAEAYVTGSGRVIRRTNQYGFSSENQGDATPYAGSDSGGSTRRSTRGGGLKRDRDEYETEAPDYEDPEDLDDEEDSEAGDAEDGDDYRDEPMEEVDDGDLTDASDEDDMADKSLVATIKFKTEAGKAAMAKLVKERTLAKTNGGGKPPQIMASSPTSLPRRFDSAMDLDSAADMDDDDVDLVRTSPPPANIPSTAESNVTTTTADSTVTATKETSDGGAPEHLVVNYLSGKGANSSPASSISQ